MRRLFCETRIYEYKTENEAIKNMKMMRMLGWNIKERGSENYAPGIYDNGKDDFPYSVEYYKGRFSN